MATCGTIININPIANVTLMEEEKEIKANIVNQMRNLLNVCMAKKDYDHQRKKTRTLADIESPILVYTTGCSLNVVFFRKF